MRGMRREKATEQKIAAFMTKLYSMNSDSELYPSLLANAPSEVPVFYSHVIFKIFAFAEEKGGHLMAQSKQKHPLPEPPEDFKCILVSTVRALQVARQISSSKEDAFSENAENLLPKLSFCTACNEEEGTRNPRGGVRL